VVVVGDLSPELAHPLFGRRLVHFRLSSEVLLDRAGDGQ
jgi:hypothetical protein